MQIDKRNRTELKQYFVKNAIPTESQFAELIDGMLNQRDDGIAKLPNDPLSIEAAGDPASQKKAIHFYNSFGDTDPAWVFSLNPRQNPADPTTARPGFSIGDSAGNSRLFIDRATGKLGIGTTTPQKKLHVQGTTSGPFLNDQYDRPGMIVTGQYPEVALFSNVDNPNHGPAIRLGSYTDGTTSSFKQWVIGTAGRNASFLDIGYSDKNDPNPHAGIRNYNGRTILTIKETGTVGIGTTNPLSTLTVGGPNASLRIASGNDNGYVFENDNADNFKLKLRYKNPTNVYSELMTFDYSNGGVGIGTAPGEYRFNVSANSIKLGLEQSGGGQLIFTHNANDNMIYMEAFSSNGQDSAAALWLTGKNARPVPKLYMLSDYIDISAKFIKLGLEAGGGGQLCLLNNANDNKIYIEAFSSNGQGNAAELLLTGRFGQPVPELSLVSDKINLRGQVFACNSDIYFTNTEHNHSGIGNTAGFAAIENAKDYGALMILGRAGTDAGRKVRLWDYLKVEGRLPTCLTRRPSRTSWSLGTGLPK